MKKTHSFLLAASIALAMAFTLSCSDDKGNDNPVLPVGGNGSLDGTWQKDEGRSVFAIQGDEATITFQIEDNITAFEGTIGYYDASGSFTAETSKGQLTVTFNYTLNGSDLTITNVTSNNQNIALLFNGVWTKQ